MDRTKIDHLLFRTISEPLNAALFQELANMIADTKENNNDETFSLMETKTIVYPTITLPSGTVATAKELRLHSLCIGVYVFRANTDRCSYYLSLFNELKWDESIRMIDGRILSKRDLGFCSLFERAIQNPDALMVLFGKMEMLDCVRITNNTVFSKMEIGLMMIHRNLNKGIVYYMMGSYMKENMPTVKSLLLSDNRRLLVFDMVYLWEYCTVQISDNDIDDFEMIVSYSHGRLKLARIILFMVLFITGLFITALIGFCVFLIL